MNPITKIALWTYPRRPVGLGTFFSITAGVIASDQATKWLATTRLSEDEPLVIIPNFFQFILRHNTGAAFSMLTGHTGLLTLISIAISVVIIAWAWRLSPEEQGMRLSLGLIFGGAIGNIIDRMRLGKVIDFIDVYVVGASGQWHWPTFNVADSAICVGITLLVLANFRPLVKEAETAPDKMEKNPPAEKA